MNVLLADDDPNVRELVMLELLERGHDVTCVQNGTELLRTVEHGPGSFNVIVTDNDMPGGPSGIDVLRVLRRDERFNLVPIVVHSGATHVKEEVIALRAVYARKVDAYKELLEALSSVQLVLRYRSHP